jgi:hypothetical protein
VRVASKDDSLLVRNSAAAGTLLPWLLLQNSTGTWLLWMRRTARTWNLLLLLLWHITPGMLL